ncbi:major facilitator superfamily domain-containing protein [Penicillium tannophilum]|nr:major facilitator superfamily domain-containing protein [Penicillium tannophilum]
MSLRLTISTVSNEFIQLKAVQDMATAVQTKTQMIPLATVDSNQVSDRWDTSVSRQVSIHGPLDNHGNELSRLAQDTEPLELSRARAVILMITLTGLTFIGSMSAGLLTVCLPGMAADLNLPDNLLLCLAQTGLQLILFRTFQGIATSMCLPTAFSIMTDSMPAGKRRNIGFSCLGLGQPFGFSVGLVLGGIFQDSTLGWRFGYYLCAGATFVLTVVNYFKLPQDRPRDPFSFRRLWTEIDWVGILLSSACLGIISYVFANITEKPSTIRNPENISLLCVAAAMIPSFWAWMQWREKSGRPALIPNSLWNNTAFATICVMVLFSWGVLNGMETILSLFLQEVQQLSAIQAALRFLPNVIIGVIVNIGTGLLVHRLRANYLVLITSILSAASPLLMAIIDPKWSWWYCVFWVMILCPLSADVIFTVANLIIADSFSPKTQGLAGAVFNTIAQFGTSIGLTTFAIIAASVTDGSSYNNKNSPEALMAGYRAVFWACFGLLLAAIGISAWGLRRVGKVGLKRE